MIRKLARSGLKGRPKQTRILLVALMLSFLFVTTSILLLHTSQVNREEQKRLAFGDWTNVYVQEDAQKKALIEQEGVIISQNRLLGLDDDFGLIGTADQNFFDMANLTMLEGRLPQAKDEIALLETQLSYFKEAPKVGEKYNILVKVSQSIMKNMGAADLSAEEIAKEIYKVMYAHWDVMLERAESGLQALENGTYIYDEQAIQGIMSDYSMDHEEATKYYRELFTVLLQDQLEVLRNKPADEAAAVEYLWEKDNAIGQKQAERIIADPRRFQHYKNMTPDEEQAKSMAMYFSEVTTRMHESSSSDRHYQKRVEVEGAGGTSMRTSIAEQKAERDYVALRYASYLGDLLRDDEMPPPEQVVYVGSVEAFMYREMTLTGIVSNYTHTWDGPTHTYPTALVTEETGQAFFENCLWLSEVPFNKDYRPKYNFFIKSNQSPYEYEQERPQESKLFSNNLGYPKAEGLSEDVLSRILLGLIALFTCFALFQISLVQLRKRLRKLALLRAVGATFSQLKALLRWEAFYILIIALPIGVLLGFAVSYLVLRFNQSATGEVLRMSIDWIMLAIGLVITTAFALIGLFLPLRQVRKVPLRGSIQVEDQKKVKKTRALIGDVEMRKQSLFSINKRHHRFIRRQRQINSALYAFILLILLGSMLLIHRAFDDYRNQVMRMGMPDFELELPYQRSQKVTDETVQKLKDVPGVSKVVSIVEGEKSFLHFEGIENNVLIKHFLEMIPEELRLQYYGTNKDYAVQTDNYNMTPEELEEATKQQLEVNEKIQSSLVVDLYGIPIASPAMEQLKTVVPADFDWQAFNSGDQVILVMPGYKLRRTEPTAVTDPEDLERFSREERMKGLMELTGDGMISYDSRLRGFLDHDPAFQNIDTISVMTETGFMSGDENEVYNAVYYKELKVGAVLNSLPDGGLWPLSKTMQGPVVIGSPYVVGTLYPSRLHTHEQLDLRDFIEFVSPTAYGRTWIHVYQENISEDTTMQIRKIASAENFMLQSPYIQKQELYNKGFRTSLIIGLLALALLLIALQILSSSFKGRLEVERERIGILQSLGVTGKAYRMNYLLDAIREVLKAILITHLILALAVTLYIVIKGMYLPFMQELTLLFDAYPWKYHILLTLAYGIFAVLVAYLPLGSILKRKPVENIRSLN